MPGRGFPPRPTALKALLGNPGKENLRERMKREPKGIPGAPKRPDWPAGAALECFDRTCTLLSAMRVLTTADGDAIRAYSLAWARFIALEAFLEANGYTYECTTISGASFLRKRPECEIHRAMVQTIRQYQQEFGLTPSARSRVSVPHDQGEGRNSDADFA